MEVMIQALLGLSGAAVIFVPIERITALRHEQRVLRPGWRSDALHFTLTSLIVRVGVIAAVAIPVVVLRLTVAPFTAPILGAVPGWMQLLLGILVADFLAYFGHRAAHTVPFLWRFHRVHHSVEEMDWLAAARLHPVDQIWTRGVAVLGLAALGFTGAVFGLYLVITPLQALFLHANTRLRFGPLRWLVGTPEWHHWHHAGDTEAVNRNFAGQLPAIDVLFGTAYMPHDRRPSRFGLGDGEARVPPGWWAQLKAPFRRTPASPRPTSTLGAWPPATQEMSTSSP
jgi:sterol desaturase/sphingolipid hydroxylase (fatty acid hydroxylase superfamily)